jgi:hypothetical protein
MKKNILFLTLGIVIGVLALLVIRFVTYNPPAVHYHANFAVYINGRRELFKGPQYYQEVNVCSLHGTTPLARVHMHDEVNNVVHVHAEAVTWGELFQNIGWGIGPDYLATPDTIYAADGDNQLNVLLNGKNVSGITNIAQTVIHDKDQLLVSYGNESTTDLAQQFKTVGNSAAKYDTQKDTSACSGGEAPTTSERLHHLF